MTPKVSVYQHMGEIDCSTGLACAKSPDRQTTRMMAERPNSTEYGTTGPKHLQICLVVVVLGGLLLSSMGFFAARQSADFSADQRFEQAADARAKTLERHLHTNLEAIHSIGALYAASDTIDRKQFRAFVEPILGRHREIQALEWIPRIRHADRRSFERAAREDGFATFRLTERSADGHMAPASRRANYYPVYYVEPLEGNKTAVGFDLASNPTAGLRWLKRGIPGNWSRRHG